MKILVMSDLHLDTGPLGLIKGGRQPGDDADVVILAGDIDEGTFGLRWARTTFPKQEIIYVVGNHEYYLGVMEEVQAAMVRCAGELGIHLLENSSVDIQGVRFLGCTLWTDFDLMGKSRRQELMERAGAAMNDYRLIRRWREEGPKHKQSKLQPEQTRQMHLASVHWLGQALDEGSAATTVVVTHHAPHPNSIPERYRLNILSGAFASDLTRLMGRSSLWVHGHMHDCMDYEVNGTRVVCNPRGYLRGGVPENDRFNRFAIFEVGV
jgi:Calcineurin-like phosphoesterase